VSWLERYLADSLSFEIFHDQPELFVVRIDSNQTRLVCPGPTADDLIEGVFLTGFIDSMSVGVSAQDHLASGVDKSLHPEFLSKA